jgi:ElaB/YqjD/DUF883 family membrane-anchored ribosome-binding protein
MMQENFIELKRLIDTTAKNRFEACDRLNRHDKWSLGTVIAFSLGLILVAIAQVTKLPVAFSSDAINAFSIFFSVFILVLSTVLSMSNFSSRADKFLDCSRELQSLSSNLVKIISTQSLQTNNEYDSFRSKYDSILSRYENHQPIDHRFTKLAWSEQHISHSKNPLNWCNAYIRYTFHFVIYILLIAIEIVWLTALFYPSLEKLC